MPIAASHLRLKHHQRPEVRWQHLKATCCVRPSKYPQNQNRRPSDAFYEQQLIREQIGEFTGTHDLTGRAGTLTLDAGNGTIHLLTAQDSRQVQTSDQSSGTMFQSMSMSAQTDTATRYNQLSAGQLAIGAGQIHVQGTAADLQAQALQLAGQPGLAWMGQLANDPRIDWQQVAEIHDQWSKSHSGLSQAGALIIALAVTIMILGAGAELAGAAFGTETTAATTAAGVTATQTTVSIGGLEVATTTTTAAGVATTAYAPLGAALNAGFSSLVSEAAVSLIDNQGNIGKTLSSLANASSVQLVLAAMLTAGVANAYSGNFGFESATANIGAGGQIQTRADRHGIHAAHLF